MLPDDAPAKQAVVFDTRERNRKKVVRARSCLCIWLLLFLVALSYLSSRIAQVKNEQETKVQEGTDTSLPQVLLDDTHLRRVCTTIGSSHLCLVVRYPQPRPLQDATKSYPSPFDEKLWDQMTHVHLLEETDTAKCTNATQDFWHNVQACLQQYQTRSNLVAVFTIQRKGQEPEFFSPKPMALEDPETILVVGNKVSSPDILQGLSSLWTDCTPNEHHKFHLHCHQNQTTLGLLDWHLQVQGNGAHRLNHETLRDELRTKNVTHTRMTFLLDPPLDFTHEELTQHAKQAHKVHRDMIRRAYQALLNASITLELEATILSFDSIPSWYPTTTGAVSRVEPTENEANQGIHCRAPLPPTSPLKELNAAGRHGEHLATWEFTNLLATQWRNDDECSRVHPGTLYKVHKYFWAAWQQEQA